MNLIHIGDDSSRMRWLSAVRALAGATMVAHVDAKGAASPLSASPSAARFASLGAALAHGAADVAICSGVPLAASVEALEAGLGVIVEEPKAAGSAELRALAAAARARGKALVLSTRDRQYASVEKLLKRYVESGRLGPLGHVSLIDHRSAAAAEIGGRPRAQLFDHAVGHFKALQRLMGREPQTVMAQLSAPNGAYQSTAAFLGFGDGAQAQYFGSLGPAQSGTTLWLEGSGGSLKTDGRNVLWRKRGWRFFAPVKFSLAGVRDDADRARAEALRRAAAGRAASDDALVATLAAVAESDEQRRVARVARSG